MPHEPFGQAMLDASSHGVWGALGGALWIAIHYTLGFRIRVGELVTRPFMGFVAAVITTEWWGWPNHQTSLLSGLVAIQLMGAVLLAAERLTGRVKQEPGLVTTRYERRPEIEQLVHERIEDLREGRVP